MSYLYYTLCRYLRPRDYCYPFILLFLLSFALAPGLAKDALGGLLSSVTPMGASSQVSIYITGTGFNATASSNEVTFIPSSGASLASTATAVTTLNSAIGLRRLTVRVPSGLPVGTTALRVLNKATGEVSEGKSLELIEISLPGVTSASPGASNYDVRITGSPNTQFTEGSVRSVFGSGVTVNSTTVESATSLIANITVSSAASLGTRNIAVITGTQTAILSGGFSIVESVSINSPPVMEPVGNSSVDEGATLDVPISASDPDGDFITLTISPLPSFAGFTDHGNGKGMLTLTPDYMQAGSYHLTCTAMDSNGASSSISMMITVRDVNRLPSINLIGNRDVYEGELLTFSINGSDPDGDPLAFSAGGLPAGAAFNPETLVFSWFPGHDQAGSYSVTFYAGDGAATAEQSVPITVFDKNRPPGITTTGLPVGRVGQAYSAVIMAQDPDGDALTYSLVEGPSGMSIDPATGGLTWRPLLSDIRGHAVSIRVDDGRGGTDAKAYTVSVPDTILPVVFLSAPKEAIPGASFTVTADASDNIGIASVNIDMDGHDSAAFSTPPYQRSIILPDVLSVGSVVTLNATARDTGGNTATATAQINIVGMPDTTPPVVTLNAPVEITRDRTVFLSATARDDVGVSSLTFYADGVSIGKASVMSPAIQYQVPQNAPVGSSVAFSVTAWDTSGNSASAGATATVTDILNETPPEVSMDVPSCLEQGGVLPVSTQIAVPAEVAKIEVYVNQTLVATYTVAADGPMDVLLPDGLEAGMDALVEVRVTDFSGNETIQSQTICIEAVRPPGTGVITGEVYDDSTGLALAVAEVVFTKEDGSTASAMTDGKGSYSILTTSGGGRLGISREGYSTVERTGVYVPENSGVEVFDVRLTPLSVADTMISAIIGGRITIPFSRIRAGLAMAPENTASSGEMSLDFPSGVLNSDRTFSLTQVSPQGLRGLLPPGWSPVGVVEITPGNLSFNSVVTLTVANPLGLTQDSRIILGTWDNEAGGWLAIAGATVLDGGSGISGEISRSGQYAFLLPDTTPQPPPAPADGDLMQGVVLQPIPQDVATQINPQPRIIFYKPGVHSDVGINITTPTTPLPSGTPVWSKITEEYNFYSGAKIYTEPYIQDIILYNYNQRLTPTASYPVTPSYTFKPMTLEKGIITVAVVVPPEGPRDVSLIGPDGGTITAPTGESLTVPPGAVADFIPVEIVPLSLSDSGIILPPGFNFAGGLSISFGGNVLYLPASISIPLPSALTGSGQFLLVKTVEVQEATRLALVGVGSVDSDRIVSFYTLPLESIISPPPQGEGQGGGGVLFEGILSGGRYLLLQTDTAIGFAGGKVYGTTGATFPGALISSDTLPIISFSIPSPILIPPFSKGGTGGIAGGSEPGSYISAVATGPFTLTALDTAKMDRGAAIGDIPAASAFVRRDISLSAEPPRVVSIDPPDDATNVSLSSPARIQFSEPLDPGTVNATHVILTGPSGDLTGSISLSSNNTIITLRPTELLTANSDYTLSLTGGIKDLAGYGMTAPFTSSFTSLDTEPPPPPPAGNINASIPGADGKTIITVTQGTAGVHDTVWIVNTTKGTSNPVLMDANGGFSATVDAGITDTLQIKITDPAGNVTIVPLGLFSNPDGSVAVGPDGGKIDGPNGIILDVPSGAFPQGSIIKINGISEAEIGVSPGPDFPFMAGFEVHSTAAPHKYLNVSVPLPDGTPSDMTGIVAEVVTALGHPALSVVDTAKVIGGRLATSSPPCPGIVKKFGRYAMFMNNDARMRALGMAVLGMVPMQKSAFMIPMIPVSPVSGGGVVGDANQSESGSRISYSPAHPFIAKIGRGEDVLTTLNAAETACLPVPADTPVYVMIRDSNNGEILQSIETSPASNKSIVQIRFKDPYDTTPPEIVEVSPSNKKLDVQNKEIWIRFSEPLDDSTVHEITLIDTASAFSKEIEGESELSENNHVLKFVLKKPLRMGKTYKMNLEKISDISGNLYKGVMPLFQTFMPYVVFPSASKVLSKNKLAGDLGIDASILGLTGLYDLDFVTQTPLESPDGAWHTDLVAGEMHVNEDSYTLFTLDLSNPVDPKARGGWNGAGRGHFKVRFLDDLFLEPRQYDFLPAQYLMFEEADQMKLRIDNWRKRELHYLVADPAIRLCTAPGSQDIVKWEKRYCETNVADDEKCAIKLGGCGDLAVTNASNGGRGRYWNFLKMYDVTERQNPVLIGRRLLSRNRVEGGYGWDSALSINDVSGFSWAPEGVGFPFGLDIVNGMSISHGEMMNPGTSGAYVSVNGIGLELVDIGLNIPEISEYEREHPAEFGIESQEQLGLNSHLYYKDVAFLRNKVIAVADGVQAGTGIRSLEVFPPSLEDPIHVIPVTVRPNKIRVIPDFFPVDTNGDDVPEDYDDAAVISGDDSNGGISLVHVPKDDSMSPEEVLYIPTSHGTGPVEIDGGHKLAYVGSSWNDDNGNKIDGILVVYIGENGIGLLDNDEDNIDDRIIGRIPIIQPSTTTFGSGSLHGFSLDEKRGLIYAAVQQEDNGLAIVKVCECSDLVVDFQSGPEKPEVPIGVEKKALQQVIERGFTQPHETLNCNLPDPEGITMIEQGSGACLWKGDDPEKICGENYQPGISDHDYEVFFHEGISENEQKCLIDNLYAQVLDEESDPIPIEVDGYQVEFDDISFFPMSREEFEGALINIMPPEGCQGDVTGDMGMGRQSLLLKWLLEGAYVDVAGLNLKGKDPEEILTILREPMYLDPPNNTVQEPSGIPRLEGYEWTILQESEVYNSGALIRIVGAAEPGTTFYHTTEKELHKVGKAAIRATLARLVADVRTNPLVLNTTREIYDSTGGCIDASTSTSPNHWVIEKCNSFEHYVASVAARSVWEGYDLFTPEDVTNNIYRFYRVKAGLEKITTDEDANKFVSTGFSFVSAVISGTEQVYNETVGNDLRAEQREKNRSAVENRTNGLKTNGKKQIIPRVSNHGPRDVKAIRVRMYSTYKTPPEVCSEENTDGTCKEEICLFRNKDGSCKEKKETWPAWSSYHLAERKEESTKVDCRVDVKKIFQLKGVNQDNPSEQGWVSLLVDLPEKTIEEPDRKNNWSKVYYYVLDKNNSAVPSPNDPELPVEDPDNNLLSPDPVCSKEPKIQIVQTVKSVGSSDTGSSDIQIYAGQCVTLEMVITNTGGQDLTDVILYSSLRGETKIVPELRVGETKKIKFEDPYCPDKPQTVTGSVIPTASDRSGNSIGTVVDANSIRIDAACPIRLSPLDPDPNPKPSEVMHGGTFYRYYKVSDFSVQPPAPVAGADIKSTFVTLNSIVSRNYTTNQDGLIETNDDLGMAVPWEEWMESSIGNVIKAELKVEGTCADPAIFETRLKEFKFSESLKAGAALDIGGKYLGVDLQIGLGGSLNLTLSGMKSSKEQTFTELSISRNADAKIGVGLSAQLFKASIKLGGTAEIKGPGVSSGLSVTGLVGDKYIFPQIPLEEHDKLRAAGLILDTLMNSSANPTNNFILRKLNNLITDFEHYKNSEFIGFTAAGNLSGQFFKGTIGFPQFNRWKSPQVNLGVGGSLRGSFTLSSERLIKERKLNDSFNVNGEISAEAGLTAGFLTEEEKIGSNPTYPGMQEIEYVWKELNAIKKILSYGGGYSGGIGVSIIQDIENNLFPEKIALTYKGKKNFGWKLLGSTLGNAEGEDQISRTYSINFKDNPQDFIKILQTMTSLSALLDTAQKARLNVDPSDSILVGPSVLYEQLVEFIHLLMRNGAYSETKEKGNGITLPIGFDVLLVGTGLNVGTSIKADHTLSYTTEKGVIRGATSYKLEDYTNNNIVQPNLGVLLSTYNEIFGVAGIVRNGFRNIDRFYDSEVEEGVIKSEGSAVLKVNNETDYDSVVGLLSYDFEEIAGPVQHYPFFSSDIIGPADKPHYGIGGFHGFYPLDYTLTTPSTLIMDYYDNEIAGFDESSLGLYVWKTYVDPATGENKGEWDYIEGVALDAVNNTVTAEITQLGIYTLAPTMPAGDVSWTVDQVSKIHPGTIDEKTRVKLSSGQLHLNNKTLVPEGTIFHVVSAVPYSFTPDGIITFGEMISPDVISDIEGVQIAIENDGKLRLEIEYPGAPIGARIVVFSDNGTAFGDQLVPIEVP